MIKPIIPETLLEIGDYEIVSKSNNILVIDNWYKNYDELYEIVTNMSVPRWKWHEKSRNFLDYYDCRPKININSPDKNKLQFYLSQIKQLINNNLKISDPVREMKLQTAYFEFNFFKNIVRDVSNNFQFTPHTDGKDVNTYNCIVYLDKICSGGTAFYTNYDKTINDEQINLLKDVSSYDKFTIQAKPNRMVIFNGNIIHGGYIENHNDYVDNWRINQILIFNSVDGK